MEFAIARMYKTSDQAVEEMVTRQEMFAMRGGYIPTGEPACGWKGELCNTGAKDGWYKHGFFLLKSLPAELHRRDLIMFR